MALLDTVIKNAKALVGGAGVERPAPVESPQTITNQLFEKLGVKKYQNPEMAPASTGMFPEAEQALRQAANPSDDVKARVAELRAGRLATSQVAGASNNRAVEPGGSYWQNQVARGGSAVGTPQGEPVETR